MRTTPALPRYQVVSRKEPGAPYTRSKVIVGGAVVYEQLGPISDAEARERVRLHVQPTPTPAVVPFPRTQRSERRPGKGAKR